MFTLNKLLSRGKNPHLLAAITTALFIASAVLARPVIADLDSALEDYVNQPDPEFYFDMVQ